MKHALFLTIGLLAVGHITGHAAIVYVNDFEGGSFAALSIPARD